MYINLIGALIFFGVMFLFVLWCNGWKFWDTVFTCLGVCGFLAILLISFFLMTYGHIQ